MALEITVDNDAQTAEIVLSFDASGQLADLQTALASGIDAGAAELAFKLALLTTVLQSIRQMAIALQTSDAQLDQQQAAAVAEISALKAVRPVINLSAAVSAVAAKVAVEKESKAQGV